MSQNNTPWMNPSATEDYLAGIWRTHPEAMKNPNMPTAALLEGAVYPVFIASFEDRDFGCLEACMGLDSARMAAKRIGNTPDAEPIWQADRVRYYYAKEHPEYQRSENSISGKVPSDVVGSIVKSMGSNRGNKMRKYPPLRIERSIAEPRLAPGRERRSHSTYLPGPEFDAVRLSGDHKVGDVPFNLHAIQETINRAYAYWMGTSSVGARPPKKVKSQSKEAKAERRAYLSTLSEIKDYKRDHPTTILKLGILRDWQNDRKLTNLVQEVTGETPGYYNIMQLAEEATPEEYEHWVNWYLHAHDDVERLQKKHNRLRRIKGAPPLPFSVVAAVVAVLSPNNSWLNNLAAADYLLTHETGEGSTAYRANAAKALAMMDSWMVDHVRGPKVTVFFESLNKPWKTGEKVVLDGHMINIWRGHKQGIKNLRQPDAAERAQMLRDFRQAAMDLGISAQSVQALTWYIWRYTTDTPKPSLKVLKLARAEFIADLNQRLNNRKSATKVVDKYLADEADFFDENLDDLDDFVKGAPVQRGRPRIGLARQTLLTLPSGNKIHISK